MIKNKQTNNNNNTFLLFGKKLKKKIVILDPRQKDRLKNRKNGKNAGDYRAPRALVFLLPSLSTAQEASAEERRLSGLMVKFSVNQTADQRQRGFP